MNAVEIEEAVSALAEKPFDPNEFPYAFLEAFGNKETTLKRLRRGESNKSDVGGVLQTNNIHISSAPRDEVHQTMERLRTSPATVRWKAKFILATDGESFEAEELNSNEAPIVCAYRDFPDQFAFFLPLVGISTVRQIRESSFDIKATGRLNRLYVELLKTNPEWDQDARRHDMNHFMARLIFCFFAEHTDIFVGEGLFTATVAQMSESDSSNTHLVIEAIFRAMNVKIADRATTRLPRWADAFPYVNGGLFSGDPAVPRFSKIARSYLRNVGDLDWRKINPDIFGSMIQAVADDEERSSLGMHYTSVPNILKVLNPLFLDDLRAKLEEAGDNARTLLNLRKRLSRIRVFDPACGSGNFLVIAYKEMREVEATINQRRGEPDRRSDIPLTNFRGIEIRDFAAEIARLALIIAQYQCDVLYRGQKQALAEFLPLDTQSWITRGNALQLDWLSICPPTGTSVTLHGDDLFNTPLDQAQINFENEGGETYICGNPPYRGSQWQTDEQKLELKAIFRGRTAKWKSLDYVAGWFIKAADYGTKTPTAAAFVSTNSICQGRQVETLWSLIFKTGHEIIFAHTSFKWTNLASSNAGVTVVIVGISIHSRGTRRLFYDTGDNGTRKIEVENINAYLAPAPNVIVSPCSRPLNGLAEMSFGNMANDGGHLLLSAAEAEVAIRDRGVEQRFIRPFVGSYELINGSERRCIWVGKFDYRIANENDWLRSRFEAVAEHRSRSSRATTAKLSAEPYRFGEIRQKGAEAVIIVPSVSSETREFLPSEYKPSGTIVSNLAFAMYDPPSWNLALIVSRLHLIWIATVCGKMKTDFRYSNTLGWNTFPVPIFTERNKSDLTRSAEDILLAREHYFPATIADMYDPDRMDSEFPLVRDAHDRNDEVLERIYIGRRFKNDTERLAKLFDLYRKYTIGAGYEKKKLKLHRKNAATKTD